ncbi:hypothetical protein EJ06DRAFT_528757 [Trichodelitschia bisporula]|uniref:Membrane fusion mating protein FIG1 n=1 Tax=Trichodelitschia bisporula TaxID=703511 RepID=A0A6G1I057_9PEZI|nr:hypothetical protein EJ06DRAFT_528757 [Trichodelitschia bisporula]
MNISFTVNLQRFVPWLGYHHVLMLFCLGAIVLWSITLAGCSSYSSMTNIYILAVEYANGTAPKTATNVSSMLREARGIAQLQSRVGYFGQCVRKGGIAWVCGGDAQTLVSEFGNDDPLSMLDILGQFQKDVLFSGFIFMAIVLVFFAVVTLATFPGWHQETDDTGEEIDVKPFPSKVAIKFCSLTSGFATVFCIVSALWQHTAAVSAATMIEGLSYGNLKASVGPGAMALSWLGVALLCVVNLGIVVMWASMAILDQLTED